MNTVDVPCSVVVVFLGMSKNRNKGLISILSLKEDKFAGIISLQHTDGTPITFQYVVLAIPDTELPFS
jgi:hypothetical protein